MLNNIIEKNKQIWLRSDSCPIKELLIYMRDKGALRDTQIEAIETYLYLKIEGENKPLWQLFSEGFFANGTDLAALNINQTTRNYLSTHKNALALYNFARQPNGKTTLLPDLVQKIIADPAALVYDQIIKNIFYGVEYADYLMSLPMGAGKTFLMAAFIYLDLYYAKNEPDNPAFAHNFLILIPSGLKSSIVPSLRSIEQFDPTWVIPDPAASELKRLLKFNILDEQKSSKRSNKARNPNAQKVNQILPNPFGQVFVVNAEKVILDRLNLSKQLELIEKSEDEKDRFANELRNLIGKIPNLSLLIDEVHHAAKDDVKLRQVVNRWQKGGNITTVLGFSGTPYLASSEKIYIDDNSFFRFSQITNTVYYYPLVKAIQTFLKNPSVEIGYNLNRLQMIQAGVEDFQLRYENKVYGDGTIAKIAIDCSNIAALEEEVYPFLTAVLNINPSEILRFHRGNKLHPQPVGSEREFRSLDLPFSKKRYILLVQVGKEGWDCRSLTAVILSQKGDSPKNMVLQTSCRCLRQVDKGKVETAVIWLNDYNADVLNQQLRKEQQTSIEELNKLTKRGAVETASRYSRMDFLELPPIDFYQLKVTYQSVDTETEAFTQQKLDALLTGLDGLKTAVYIKTTTLGNLDEGAVAVINQTGYAIATFNQWLHIIARESFSDITTRQLHAFAAVLKRIFERITYEENGRRFWNELYDLYAINGRVRLAFNIKRELQTDAEIIPQEAHLLIVEKLKSTTKSRHLYPNEIDTEKILRFDKSSTITHDESAVQTAYADMKAKMEAMGMEFPLTFEQFRQQQTNSLAVLKKDSTFHYLPYNFTQSGFEKEILQEILQLQNFTERGLELYYNGERGLTEFVITCFAKSGKYWKNIGRYTTDFLIIKRNPENAIHKALLIETKGEGFSNDPIFLQKKAFVQTKFLQQNNDKFGYERFDFLYLEDSHDIAQTITAVANKIDDFFA